MTKIDHIYGTILTYAFPKFEEHKLIQLKWLLVSKHDDNADEYITTPTTKYIFDHINVISIYKILHFNIEPESDNMMNNCIKYNMITDVLQKKIFMHVNEKNYTKNIENILNDNTFINLIRDWYKFTVKLDCIMTVDKDKLYDKYKAIYFNVLLQMIIINKNKIQFVIY